MSYRKQEQTTIETPWNPAVIFVGLVVLIPPSLSISLTMCVCVCVLCPTLPVILIAHSWFPVLFSLTLISFQHTNCHKLQFTYCCSILYGFRFQFEIIIGVFTFVDYIHLYNFELYGRFPLLILASIQHSGIY